VRGKRLNLDAECVKEKRKDLSNEAALAKGAQQSLRGLEVSSSCTTKRIECSHVYRDYVGSEQFGEKPNILLLE